MKAYPEYVCGICGGSESDEDSCCVNGHDKWVSREDLWDPEYEPFIKSCVLSRDELETLLGVNR